MDFRLLMLMIITFVLPGGLAAQVGGLDAAELYNSGTKAYEEGDMATAVYDLELAHMLAPYDAEIKHNLRIAKGKVAVDIVEIDGFFLKEWTLAAAHLLSPGLWRYITIALLLAALALLYVRMIVGKRSALSSWLTIGLVCLLAVTAAGLGIAREQVLTGGRYGVVLTATTALKEGPDPVSADVKEVSAGVKVEVLDKIDGWYKLAAMDREQGWLPIEQVRLLVVE